MRLATRRTLCLRPLASDSMAKMLWIKRLVLLAALLSNQGIARSQCRVPSAEHFEAGPNLFTLAQEVDLGDAMAEVGLTDLRILAEGDAHLQQIATRLVQNTPLAQLPVRTFIIDIPETNAFVIPGGRVYISRNLLGVLNSDDEVAGILAHELGHLAAHQQAIRTSRLMKALGIKALGDRRDVFDKYAQIMENAWRKPSLAETPFWKEEKDQMEADRLGLAMQVGAGFAPQAQIRALDRVLETQGKTGNFFSNLIEFNPDQKRLGELVRNLPASCGVTETSNASFAAWRKSLLDLNAQQYAEALPIAQVRVKLQSLLRDDLRKIAFSSDGRYLLAQDEGGINVLTVDPFVLAFRIAAENVSDASFTPDSQEIVFLSSTKHVERWSVASQGRTGSTDLVNREGCLAELLSPDGRLVACHLRSGSLRLVEVATNSVLLEKKDFGIPWSLFDEDSARLAFSPDGRYFLALPPHGAERSVLFDLRLNATIALQGDLKKLRSEYFAFLDAEKVIMSPISPKIGTNVTASVVKFPTGEVLSMPVLPSGPLYGTANPDRVIVRPLGKFAAGAIEYATGNGITSKVAAMDFCGRYHAVERTSGELALYDEHNKAIAAVRLPADELSQFRSFAISPDMKWMAASARNRGGLWNLQSGEAVAQFLGFDGGYFDATDHLLADVPKFNDVERHVIDIGTNPLGTAKGPDVKGPLARQIGAYVVDMHSDDGSPLRFFNETGTFENLTLDVFDARNTKPLWSRHFKGEAPQLFFDSTSGQAVFLWTSTSDRVRHDPSLRSALGRAEDAARLEERNCSFSDLLVHASPNWGGVVIRAGLMVAEIVSLASGEQAGKPVTVNLVDRCNSLTTVAPIGTSVVMEDLRHRVLIFSPDAPSAEASEARLRVFGHLADVDQASRRFAVRKDAGRLVVYDGVSGEQISDLKFGAPLLAARFANKGHAIVVVTARQETFRFALP